MHTEQRRRSREEPIDLHSGSRSYQKHQNDVARRGVRCRGGSPSGDGDDGRRWTRGGGPAGEDGDGRRRWARRGGQAEEAAAGGGGQAEEAAAGGGGQAEELAAGGGGQAEEAGGDGVTLRPAEEEEAMNPLAKMGSWGRRRARAVKAEVIRPGSAPQPGLKGL